MSKEQNFENQVFNLKEDLTVCPRCSAYLHMDSYDVWTKNTYDVRSEEKGLRLTLSFICEECEEEVEVFHRFTYNDSTYYWNAPDQEEETES